MKVYGWPSVGTYVPDSYHLEGSNDDATWVTINGSVQTTAAWPEQTYNWSWTN